MDSQEAIKGYLEVYQVAYAESQGSYVAKKRKANEAAREVYPEIGKCVSAFTRARKNGDSMTTEEERIGVQVVTELKKLKLKESYESSFPNETSEKTPTINAIKLYREWIEKNKYIPDDLTLAHFTGRSWKTFASIRSKLLNEGYEFEKIEGDYWKIIRKPQSAISQQEVSKVVSEVIKEAVPQFIGPMVEEVMKRLGR